MGVGGLFRKQQLTAGVGCIRPGGRHIVRLTMRRFLVSLSALVASLFIAGSAPARERTSPSGHATVSWKGSPAVRTVGLGYDSTPKREFKRYCLVLSVGEAKGVAHLGAIEALRNAPIRISCVMGNSMGALVGSLYATAPNESTTRRYQRLLKQYKGITRERAGGNASLLALGGALITLPVGGWGVVAGAGAGATLGAASTTKLDLRRFETTLDVFFRKAVIEQLPVPFATTYIAIEKEGLSLVTRSRGSVAEAVIRSIANPMVFQGFVPQKAGYLDPGVDRMAAVPVVDACSEFPGSLLVAINVTDKAAVIPPDIACPVYEIHLPLDVAPAALGGSEPAFKETVAAGRALTKALLGLKSESDYGH